MRGKFYFGLSRNLAAILFSYLLLFVAPSTDIRWISLVLKPWRPPLLMGKADMNGCAVPSHELVANLLRGGRSTILVKFTYT